MRADRSDCGRTDRRLRFGTSRRPIPASKALDEVSFSLKRHTVLGLVGENGAGKSTLLSIINGSVRPDSGTLSIDGHPVRFGHPTEAARHGVATVFQEQGLIGTIPVYENIFLGREHKFLAGAGWLRQRAMIAEAKAVLDDLHVDVDPRALTGSLSFGQRQLVEIAKAFALSRVYPVEPIILLDEPTSALSDQETVKLFEGIARWRTRASFVFVSHRLADIFATCDEFVALKDGRVVDQRSTIGIDELALHELIVGRQRNAEYYREASQRELGGGHRPTGGRDLETRRTRERLVRSAERRNSRRCRRPWLRQVDAREDRRWRGGAGGRRGANRRRAAAAGLATRRDSARHRLRASRATHRRGHRQRYGRMESDFAESRCAVAAWAAVALFATQPRADEALDGEAAGPRSQPRHDVPQSVGRQPTEGRVRQMAGAGNAYPRLDDPGRGLDVGAKEDIYGLMREIVANDGSILLVSDNLPELIGLSNRILVLRDGAMSALIGAEQGAKPREAEVVAAMV